ncbi:hypothetical protein A33M_3960 [Rhodovulum sp. PH10]|nr:hypothetical protein A33M_3960 [Rhodovulum sp. PH10]
MTFCFLRSPRPRRAAASSRFLVPRSDRRPASRTMRPPFPAR